MEKSGSVPVSGWQDGFYEIAATPRDMAGNVGSVVHASFTLDSSIAGPAPTAKILNPASGSTVSGIINLTYQVSSDVIEVWVDYWFGREEPVPYQPIGMDATVDGTFSFDTRQYGGTLNWIVVRLFVKSSNGLTAVSAPVTLNVVNE